MTILIPSINQRFIFFFWVGGLSKLKKEEKDKIISVVLLVYGGNCHLHHLQRWCTIFSTGVNVCSDCCMFCPKLFFCVPFLPSFEVKVQGNQVQNNCKIFLVNSQCIFRVFFLETFFVTLYFF